MAFPPAEQYLGILVVAARQAMRQAICARAKPYRLTSQQFWSLVAIRLWPGITLGEMAEAMRLDPPAASRLIQQLVSRRLVEERPDPSDRRRVRLHLARRGEALGERLAAIHDEFRSAMCRGMDDAEMAALHTGLRRIVDNLAEFRTEAKAAGCEDEARAEERTELRAANPPRRV
ncbi:MAG TPA: MarR family transcriptional regulator, partial [Anaeromyxobacteraceae bacterium]|nr:MarR family transcriptional regulator [Anaeromyxobacteraceae bacterium]